MIARENRFHGYGSLNFVYRKGRTVRSGSLTLRYTHAKQEDYRLAVVVSKKVSKSAVVRNRIRRRIYEVVRTYKKEQAAAWPYDLVLTVFDDSIMRMSANELTEALVKILEQAELTKPR